MNANKSAVQRLIYTGRGFFVNCPRTWVPVQPVQIFSSMRPRLSRVQFPLRLCYAMTIHKSQSLTAPEGTVLSFKSKRNVAKVAGLAYVGCTRATTWARQAFRGVPQLQDFLAVRLTSDFKRRERFEAWADEAHEATMLSMAVTEEAEMDAHVLHLSAAKMRDFGRSATEQEIDDLKQMLLARGVAAVPEETLEALREEANMKADKPSLAELVQHMRGSRRFVFALFVTYGSI